MRYLASSLMGVLCWVSILTNLSLATDDVDPQVAEAIANAPGPEEFPQAAAVFLFDRSTVDVDQKGLVTKQRHCLIKILQVRGKDEYGDQSIRYDEEKQQVEILIARTHTPAGNIVEPEKDGITETSAKEVQWASAYSNAKVKSVHFPALEPGAAIELLYREVPIPQEEEEQEIYVGGKHEFQNYDPILEKSLTLVAPKDMLIIWEMKNSNLLPRESLQDDKRMNTWVMTDIPQVIKEPNMVPLANVVPKLVYSSMDSWEQLAQWFAKPYFQHLTDDESVKEFVRSQGWLDLPADEAFKEVILYLQTRIRSVDLSLGLAGYEPFNEGVILEHKYGDCRDKVLLGIAFLRELGIQAYPFLVNRHEVDVVDLPAIEQFDHILLAVDLGSQHMRWIDLQDDNSAYRYLPNYLSGAWGLLVTPEGGTFRTTPDVLLQENQAGNLFRATLNKDGDLSGIFLSQCQGIFDRQVRRYLKDKKEREMSMAFQQVASRIAEGTIIESTKLSDLKRLDQPARIEMSFRAEDYGVTQEDVALFYLPEIPIKLVDFVNYTSLPTVTYPVDIDLEGTVSYRLELTFPQGLTIGYAPPDGTAENEWMMFHRITGVEDNRLVINSELTYKTEIIPVEGYADAKALFADFVRPQNWLVIFEK
jgi:transglutaminase-like putative cysteine protease